MASKKDLAVDGWGVIREFPYYFVWVYPTEAQALAVSLGPLHLVRKGKMTRGVAGEVTFAPDDAARTRLSGRYVREHRGNSRAKLNLSVERC